MQDQSFNNFENNEIKLSVKEAKLIGLSGLGTCCYSTGLDFKIYLLRRFMEDVRTRRRICLSPSKLGFGPLELNFWEIHFHLTF